MFDADGELALIDLREPVPERERKKERESRRGEFGQDLKKGCKEDLRPTLKPVAQILSPSCPSRY